MFILLGMLAVAASDLQLLLERWIEGFTKYMHMAIDTYQHTVSLLISLSGMH